MNSKCSFGLASGDIELHCIALLYSALQCIALLYLQHPDFPAPPSPPPPPCLGAVLLEFTDIALPGFTEAFLGFCVAMLFLLTDLYISALKGRQGQGQEQGK